MNTEHFHRAKTEQLLAPITSGARPFVFDLWAFELESPTCMKCESACCYDICWTRPRDHASRRHGASASVAPRCTAGSKRGCDQPIDAIRARYGPGPRGPTKLEPFKPLIRARL